MQKCQSNSKIIGIILKKLYLDPSAKHVDVIWVWKNKWLSKDQISEEVADWFANNNAKP